MKNPAKFWAVNGFKSPPYYNKTVKNMYFSLFFFFFGIEVYI